MFGGILGFLNVRMNSPVLARPSVVSFSFCWLIPLFSILETSDTPRLERLFTMSSFVKNLNEG